MSAKLMWFNALLKNPLWQVETCDENEEVEPGCAKYIFHRSTKRYLVFIADTNTGLVTATAYPKEDETFVSRVLNFEKALSEWFIPYLWDDDTTAFVKMCLVQRNPPLEWGIDISDMPYTTTFNFYNGNDYYTIILTMNENGGLAAWSGNYYYSLHQPDEDLNPIHDLTTRSFQEFTFLFKRIFEKMDAAAQEELQEGQES